MIPIMITQADRYYVNTSRERERERGWEKGKKMRRRETRKNLLRLPLPFCKLTIPGLVFGMEYIQRAGCIFGCINLYGTIKQFTAGLYFGIIPVHTILPCSGNVLHEWFTRDELGKMFLVAFLSSS